MEASDSITVVKDFFNEPNQLMRTKQIIDENLFEKIKLNFDGIAYLSTQENGYTDKLALISKILKSHNYSAYDFVIKFDPTTLGDLSEKFYFKMVAEPNNSIYKPHQNDIHDFSKELTHFAHSIHQGKNSKERPRFSDLLLQLSHIKELFEMFRKDFDEESSFVLTALSLYEMEKASIADSIGFCYYQELFNQADTTDTWFSAIMVKSVFQKPVVTCQSFVN